MDKAATETANNSQNKSLIAIFIVGFYNHFELLLKNRFYTYYINNAKKKVMFGEFD